MPKKRDVKTEYLALLGLITDRFISQWNEGYKQCKRQKAALLDYMPVIYRRWYFSALVDESLLTPANLVVELNKAYKQPMHNIPRLRLVTGEDGKLVPEFDIVDFSNGHPIIKDLSIFLNALKPSFDASALNGRKLPKALEAMSLTDSEYLNFLLGVSVTLKLVRMMPSINTTVCMVNSSFQGFFDSPEDVMLGKVKDAVISMCGDALSEILPIKKTYKKRLAGYLDTPKTIDDIFGDMFRDTGLDIEGLFDDFNKHLDILNDMIRLGNGDMDDDEDLGADINDIRADIMTGTFFLGVSLDKYFLTPLSYYLRFIQPLYILPYDLREELPNICGCLPGADDPGTLIYSPCTAFDHTELWKRLAVDGRKTEAHGDGMVYLPDDTPVTRIILSLDDIINQTADDEDEITVLTIKIRFEQDKRLWQNMELPSDMTLDRLHIFICLAFSMNPRVDYSFFDGINESPFFEYAPKNAKGRDKRKNAGETPLESLNLEAGSELLYRVYDSDEPYGNGVIRRKIGFSLTVLKTSVEAASDRYPRISRKSKEVISREG